MADGEARIFKLAGKAVEGADFFRCVRAVRMAASFGRARPARAPEHPAIIESRSLRVLQVIDHVEARLLKLLAKRKYPVEPPAGRALIHHHLIKMRAAREQRPIGGHGERRYMGIGTVLANIAQRAFSLDNIAKGAMLDDEDAASVGRQWGCKRGCGLYCHRALSGFIRPAQRGRAEELYPVRCPALNDGTVCRPGQGGW